MFKISMHEHISNQLSYIEVGRKEKMQPKEVVQVIAPSLGSHGTKEEEHVDNKQILCYCRYIVHSLLFQ